MKINVDAAISKNLSKATAAAIARDGEGNFLAASVLVVDGCTDLESMEATICRGRLSSYERPDAAKNQTGL